MPFVKKNDVQGSQPLTEARSSFVGRMGELLFFVQNILKPAEPTHNIISIWGQGGVGKSTLLARFIDEAHSAEFKDYCLTALVDERQTTPMSIMEKFADQLHMKGEFEKALKKYKEALRNLQTERETMQDAILNRVPDFAGAAAEMVPFVGPLLREGAKATAGIYLDKRQKVQGHRDAEILEDPINELTRVFVDELNQLAESQVLLGSQRVKKRRVLLFFDTFEQLAVEAVPWLLNYFLPAEINGSIVLMIAGRDPVERSISDDTKRWLQYSDNETIYWIPLNSFTEDETRAYLIKRNITDPERIATIWQLSRGLPLYLGLLTVNPLGKVDPMKDVVENFLRWIPQQEHVKRRLALDAALLSRPFNQDDLEVFSYVPESDRTSLYQWLTEQPFVRSRSQDGRYVYHDVVRDLFSRHLYQRSQKHYYKIRGELAAYYQGLLEKIQVEQGKEVYRLEEWLELLLAVVFQLLLLPDQTGHIQVIEYVLRAYHDNNSKDQNTVIARTLHDLSQGSSLHSINPAEQWVAIQLLHYVEGDQYSQEWLTATDALLEKVMHAPSFPSELLAGIYYRRASVYNRLDTKLFNRKLAIENYQQALKLFESGSSDKRAWAYFYSENYQEAFAIHNYALEQNPQDIDAYFGRGWAYLRLERYQLAIDDFEHVRELDPNYNNPGGLYNGLSQAYYAAREYQQALSMYDRLLELGTKWHWSFFGRGLTYLWLRNPLQAQADFTRSYELLLLEPLPRYEGRQIRYALMVEWAAMCQKAIDPSVSGRLETIVSVDSSHYSAHVCQGIALLLRKNFGEALAELERALLRKNNDTWEAYFWKGMTDAFLGQDEEATAAIEKALELELPPILLTPLRWFEQQRPDFYEKYVAPLLAKYA